jgi:putative FmdB family regulatory protein
MPLFDYECQVCEYRFEVIERADRPKPIECPECKFGMARRIISAGRCFTGNQDAAWVRSVTEVVAKGEDADAHDRRFHASGKTRADLREWMKAKGYRHLENGEPRKPQAPKMDNAAEQIMRMRYERRKMEIRGR